MKIGVFSDTHDQWDKIEQTIEIFLQKKVDKIIHCGDVISPFMVRPMKKLEGTGVEAIGVFGNNDGERAGMLKHFGETLQFKGDFYETVWDGKSIAIYHGTNPLLLKNIIKSQQYDLVCTGHTHQIQIKKEGRTIVLNPGTVSGFLADRSTFAIVELNTEPLNTSAISIIDI
ncbi:Phosphodiesterase [Candidatus Lokiarchaeum ossiferum]|uniref:Phosphoesterase n=1 Tax=Candidatus Lokiarchaeum ossiferum TaxID=2951803 RepID=A0ABY6HVF8_9ARCH|nr:Phosphodiesterase [Candidatus Lokiarchaeum sp. B-35]